MIPKHIHARGRLAGRARHPDHRREQRPWAERSPSSARAPARASFCAAATSPSSSASTMKSKAWARRGPRSQRSTSRPRRRWTTTIWRPPSGVSSASSTAWCTPPALLGDRTPLEQYDVPTWCRVLHVNLTAPFILTQVLLPNLRKSADASVIFVSSGVVKNPRPFWGAYAVAKTGLESVRSMLSQELEGEAEYPREQRQSRAACAPPCAPPPIPAEDPNTLPTPASVTGPFLYLLSAQGRGIDGEYFDAQ